MSKLTEQLRECKRKIILEALTEAGGNIKEAANNLGHPRRVLHRMIVDLGLRHELARIRYETAKNAADSIQTD